MRRSFVWPAVGCSAVVALLLFFAGRFLLALDDLASGEPVKAACSKVADFAGGSMPEQATGAVCTDTSGWRERGYEAAFRMPRADLAARLVAAFPRVRLISDETWGMTLRNRNESDQDRPEGKAWVVELEITYADDTTALVKLVATNV
ncbi:hypothetical protein [Kitasatospora sp. NPDC005856]|uniref:hypothetical protein n=1 Tax=Kitasatospora sp. NPDC005856 TaxID=3154566 RepID=UPI0033CEE64A